MPLPLPHLFDYAPPPGAVADAGWIGCRVRVPFGARTLIGVVVANAEPQPRASPLRQALERLDQTPLLYGELLDSLRWLARYTHAPLGEVLATALPAALRRGDALPRTHAWAWRLCSSGRHAWPGLRDGGRPHRLATLLATGARDEDSLDAMLPGWRTAARTLAERGLIERIAVTTPTPTPTPQPGPDANDEQRAAIAQIRAAVGFQPLLLDGVTGSGKTEVYLQAIIDCLARGRQALVLVPEIGLTPQLLTRFRARLGVPIHVAHSGLGDGVRARAWAAAWRGQARVVIGTRSAVFTPLPEPGLIIIDEEHDASYKQQDGIRYHGRDFALVRGQTLQVPVLLGSATPALESLHNARRGRYVHLRLHHRAGAARPPSVRILDVRKRPLRAGLSPELIQAIDAAITGGGQALIFKNRRGYAPVLLCHDCGWSALCPRCSTAERPSPMTVHGDGGLQCHHCGRRQPRPAACPDCAGLGLQAQGVGTERIEEFLAARFPDIPVLRIDRGSARRRDGLAQALRRLGSDPGILVGTQMLAKGHDLPQLTLVGVVGIDEGLFSADFRAGEKLAQLLIQVAGRAGRAQAAGHVVLQTHHPQHPLLHTLIRGGYHAFADGELALREAARLPPFQALAILRAEASQAAAPMRFLAAARDCLVAAGPEVEVSAPLPAPMPRRAGMHRAQLLLTAAGRHALQRCLAAGLEPIHALPQARRVRWSVDVDPIDPY